MKNKSTKKILDILNQAKNRSQLNEYIRYLYSRKDNLDLSEYILKTCKSKGYNKSDIIKNSSLHRTYGYQILNGKRSPSRDKLIKICIGNNLSLNQSNKSLTLAKLGVLYARDPRDSIIIYALNNELSIIETNFILDEYGLLLLGHRQNST